MDQFKFSLGPYVLFSSIIGGVPLFLAAFCLYNPVESVTEFVPIVQENASIAIALVVLFICYILGSIAQGISWQYFVRICKLLNQSDRYFSELIPTTHQRFVQQHHQINFNTLTFEERIVWLIDQNIGIPKRLHWLDARLTAYLREHDKQAALEVIERHGATHIMYRLWSFGFCILACILSFNILRTSGYTFEAFLLPILSFAFAYFTFYQALNFKRWHNRELLLGFYFAASKGA